ncbi:hypothetical protein WB876_003779 [Vibrio vulnificus]
MYMLNLIAVKSNFMFLISFLFFMSFSVGGFDDKYAVKQPNKRLAFASSDVFLRLADGVSHNIDLSKNIIFGKNIAVKLKSVELVKDDANCGRVLSKSKLSFKLTRQLSLICEYKYIVEGKEISTGLTEKIVSKVLVVREFNNSIFKTIYVDLALGKQAAFIEFDIMDKLELSGVKVNGNVKFLDEHYILGGGASDINVRENGYIRFYSNKIGLTRIVYKAEVAGNQMFGEVEIGVVNM